MKRVRNKSAVLLWAILLLTACSGKEIFSEFCSFANSEWNKDVPAKFEIEISANETGNYDVFLEIRNNNDYPFRNLWLFVDVKRPDGKQRTDTLNIELADALGKWYGKGISVYSRSVLFEQQATFLQGTYIYSVRQGMREDMLKGISDIGLTVAKHTEQ